MDLKSQLVRTRDLAELLRKSAEQVAHDTGRSAVARREYGTLLSDCHALYCYTLILLARYLVQARVLHAVVGLPRTLLRG